MVKIGSIYKTWKTEEFCSFYIDYDFWKPFGRSLNWTLDIEENYSWKIDIKYSYWGL